MQGVIASGVSYVLQSWCVQRAGPFIASVYNPLQMVFAAALAVLIFGDTVFLGTLVTLPSPPILQLNKIQTYCSLLHSFVQDHLDLEFPVHESVGPGCSFGNFILKTGSCLETCIQQKPRNKSHEICKEVAILVYVSRSNSCLHWCFC